jgi:2-isopropylmalate synthase
MLDDETLRDGLQSPSVCTPAIDQKIDILQRMDALGIDTADIGLPGAGPHVAADVERLARAIQELRLSIHANCAARTVVADIEPIADIAQRTGLPIECCTFIGSSPIRQYAEGWTLDYLKQTTEAAIRFAVDQGLTVMYVTEDTTRADPDSLRALFTTAIRAGASRLCIADTVGHATPTGAAAVVGFVKRLVGELGADVGIDWHGHSDRGFGVASALAAVEAGASRVHGAALGIGERCGNTPMDLLLVNLVMMGYLDRDLSTLPGYCQAVSRACELPRGRGRCVSYRHGGARRGGRQGFSQAGSRADGCGLRGGARQPRRPRAADRRRSDVGQVERRVLAREPRAAGGRRHGRADLRGGEAIQPDAHFAADRSSAARDGRLTVPRFT